MFDWFFGRVEVTPSPHPEGGGGKKNCSPSHMVLTDQCMFFGFAKKIVIATKNFVHQMCMTKIFRAPFCCDTHSVIVADQGLGQERGHDVA